MARVGLRPSRLRYSGRICGDSRRDGLPGRPGSRASPGGAAAVPPRLYPPPVTIPFVALDFETAHPRRDSACAVALVKVAGGRIVSRETRLVRPPRRPFHYTSIHGITWSRVEEEPSFADLWPDLEPLLKGAAFLAAHNAPFDRSVLAACCRRARILPPELPFLCTVQVARRTWNIHPTRLPDVCRRLDIPLRHHEAGSDAEACARIVLAAAREVGWDAVTDSMARRLSPPA